MKEVIFVAYLHIQVTKFSKDKNVHKPMSNQGKRIRKKCPGPGLKYSITIKNSAQSI